MRFIICLAIAIFLISLQTALIIEFLLLPASFDFLISFIVFLILFRSWSETWLVIILGGLAVNTLSGAPMGVYMITYILLFIFFKNVKAYFHTLDSFLFIILVMIGVMVEQVIFGAFIFIQESYMFFSMSTLRTFFSPIFMAGVLSPLILMLFNKIFYLFDRLSSDDRRTYHGAIWKQGKKIS